MDCLLYFVVIFGVSTFLEDVLDVKKSSIIGLGCDVDCKDTMV